MNKNILKKYYEMQGKVILPEQKDNDNIELAASVAANFASIGFPMTTEQTKALAKADKEDIIEFYEDNYDMLSDVIGAGRQPKPFYPDFPEGCMERSHAAYFIDQVIYCLSGLELTPDKYMEEKKTFPFIGEPMRRVLMAGSKEDLDQTFDMAVKSAIAYSKSQRDFIMLYVKENPEKISALIDNVNIKNRENAVTCAMMIEELTGNSMYTARFMKQPADLLRYAVFKTVQKQNETTTTKKDPYAAIALRGDDKKAFVSLGRKERRFVMDQLAKMDKGDGEKLSNFMHGHDKEWKALFDCVHISDRTWGSAKYDNVKRAISVILGGEKLDRPARRIEEAIKAENVDLAVKECAKQPGEFMRRFDKLYRMAIEQGKEQTVLDAMSEVSAKAGIATVTGTVGNIEMRDHDEEERYFKGKTGVTVRTTDKNRKGFTKEQIEKAAEIAMKGMSEKFAGKEPIGKVFMSDSLTDVKIPADVRDNSGAVGSMTSGSKMPIADDWNKMRFFTSWTNMEPEKDSYGWDNGRIDIDLTVAFCDKDMNIVQFCGWNGAKNGEGFVYSGDVQDGGDINGEGAAEYVDLDLEKLKADGVAYAIPQVNSYTGQKFFNQPHTYFGVMKRTDKDMGKLFEPAAVVNKFILDADARQASMYVIDINNREILWLNEKAQENVASRGLDGILNQVGRAAGSKTMSLSRLIEANVIANGEFVKSPKEADIIFVRDADEMQQVKEEFSIPDTDDGKFKLSNNMEYITGYLMQEGKKEANERVKEIEKVESVVAEDIVDGTKEKDWEDR